MAFTLGDLLLLVDRSFLNPWLSGLILAGVKVLDNYIQRLILRNDTAAFLSSPTLRSALVWFFGIGLTLRANRALSRKALNNGVSARFDWGKEIVLVTGGAGGIGAATARKLATKSAAVVALDVLPLTYEAPPNLHYYRCDLTDYSALQSVADSIRKEVGEPTCVVANAGICRGKSLLDASPRDVELTFGVNNLALIWTAKTFLPSMVKNNHGHFLVMASQTSHSATAHLVDYSATKAAAIAIYEGIQTEMKHCYQAPAVRISCVSPCAVDTKMFSGIKAPSNFIVPRLQPKDVGSLVADVLWSGEAQNVMTPAFAYISPPTRALPDWWRVGLADGGAPVMSGLKPHHPMD